MKNNYSKFILKTLLLFAILFGLETYAQQNIIAQTQNITVQLDANGEAIITPQQINNGSTATTGIQSLNLDTSDFNCTDINGDRNFSYLLDGETDATGDEILVDDTNLTTLTTQTIEAWIRPATGASDNDVLVAVRNNIHNSRFSIHINADTNTIGIFNSTNWQTITTIINANQWYHIALVMNSTKTLVYLDGAFEGEISTGINTSLGANAPLSIGSPNDTGWYSEKWEGNIDDLRIWNDERTALEIANNRNIELVGNEAGLVGYFDFNEGTGNTITNLAGTVNGTANNSQNANWSTDSPIESNGNTVNLTVTDVNGNSATTPANVIVVDNIAPIAPTLADVTGECSATVTAPTTTDNCAGTITGTTTDSLTYTTQGTHIITWNFDDGNGNSTTASQNVIISDSTPPTAITNNISVNLDANGNASITPQQIDNGSSDACGISSISCSRVGGSGNGLTNFLNGTLNNGTADIIEYSNSNAPNYRTSFGTTCNEAWFARGMLCDLAPNQNDPDNSSRQDNNAGATWRNTSPGNSYGRLVIDLGSSQTINAMSIFQMFSDGKTTHIEAFAYNGNLENPNSSSPGWNQLFPSTSVGAGVLNGTTVSSPLKTTFQSTNTRFIKLYAKNDGSLGFSGYIELRQVKVFNTNESNACDFNCDDLGENNVTLTVEDKNGNISTKDAIVTIIDAIAPALEATPADLTVECHSIPDVATISATDNCDSNISVNFTEQRADGFSNDNYTLTRTWSATDQSGNTVSESQVITVQDVTPPTIVGQNISVTLTASGTVSIIPQNVLNNGSDTCSTVSYTISQNTFGATDAINSPVTIQLIGTDESGNATTIPVQVTVIDPVPVVITQNIVIQLDDNGTVVIDPLQIDNGSSSAVGIGSLSLDISAFNCEDINNPVTVTLTVTSTLGSSSTGTAIVTVQDTIAPIAPILSDILGECSATATTPTTTDNCAGSITGTTTDSLEYTIQGTHTITWSFDDGNGNTTTATQNVIVNDTTAPIAITKNITIPLDASGNAIITPQMINNGSSDNCEIDSITLDNTVFDCSNVDSSAQCNAGTALDLGADNDYVRIGDPFHEFSNQITVSWWVNFQGNSAWMTQSTFGMSSNNTNVWNMHASGANGITWYINDNGAYRAVSLNTTAGWHLITGVADTTSTRLYLDGNLASTDTGINNIRVNANSEIAIGIDGRIPSRNRNFQTDEVLIYNRALSETEIQDLLMNCPDISDNSLVGYWAMNEGSGNTIEDQSITGANGVLINMTDADWVTSGINNIGAGSSNEVTLTVTDVNGNSSTAIANVTVNDITAPTLNDVPANVTVECDAIPNAATISASDNCGNPTITFVEERIDGKSNDNYTLNRTWTATDQSENSVSHTQIITVQDTTAPFFDATPVDITVECETVPAAATISASDNCGNPTITFVEERIDGISNDNYTLTRTWTATDLSGNTVSESQIITVQDVTAPTVVGQNISVTLTSTGTVSIVPENVLDNGSDNCGTVTYSVSQDTFGATDAVNSPVTVQLTGTDASGNATTVPVLVTVIDPVPVVITQNIVVQLDDNGTVVIDPSQIDNGSSSAVGIGSLSLDISAFNCEDINNPVTVTLTVTSTLGSSSTGTAIVTVQDTIAPIAPILSDILGECSATATTPTTTDNCAGSITGTTTDYLEYTAQGIHVITWSFDDGNGNIATATQNVIVIDVTAPTAIAQDISINLDDNGNATITPQQIDNDSNDACGIASTSLDKNSFDCSNVGSSASSSSFSFDGIANANGDEILVNDTSFSTLTAQTIEAWIRPASGSNGNESWLAIRDRVGNSRYSIHTNPSANTIGVYNSTHGYRTISISTGINANQWYHVAMVMNTTRTLVYVNGTLAGQIAAGISTNHGANVPLSIGSPNDASYYGEKWQGDMDDLRVWNTERTATEIADNRNNELTGNEVGLVGYFNFNEGSGNSVDNLAGTINGTANNSQTENWIDESPISGSTGNMVTLTVTDVNGNSSTATANVTVVDNISPEISDPADINVFATSAAGAVVNYNTPIGTDNCTVTTALTAGLADGETFPIGTTVVSYTATDGSGNTATATFNVIVTGLPPEIVVPEDITVNNDSGECGAIVNYAATETVGIPASTITYDIEPGSFFAEGTVTVTATATNPVGTSTKTFTVTVNDNQLPSVLTQNLIINLDANGNSTITPQQIDNGSSDNCGIASISLDNDTFNCSNVSTNTVTLTVTDVNGNSNSLTANVTVNDVTAPNVITQNIIIELDENGEASITPADIDNNSTDACGIESYSLDKDSFDCSNTGDNTVVLTVTDVNGNDASLSATVTVQDNIAPTVITQSYSIDLTNGVADIIPSNIDGGTFDNCDFTLSIDRDHFTCDDIGDHVVTLTATDASGNSSSETAIVSILGNVPTIGINDFNIVQTQKKNTIFLGFGPQSINLSTVVDGGSGFTYEWTTSTGEVVSNQANPTINPTVSTTYYVTVTNANGCTASTSIYVCVIDARAYDRKGRYKGKVLVCHHTNGKKGTKHVMISISKNAVMQHLTKHGIGTDHADSLGACNAQCVTNQTILARTKTINLSSVTTYPNPSNGIFEVRLSKAEDNTRLLLFDLTGKLILHKTISTKKASMGSNNLPSGVYILKVIYNDSISTKKLIIEKGK
ncbi:putative secreted protein (Por secretion system target) [Lutibacter sp. Hel_I_33_5]|uniref:LamG-like jellyroll fold domain-containing protein n=1 Tax=Lutibacter sp. Hel_I_33_5 TaxID=1566289 RepID=UPI0011A035F0|nr:LamG-like jellyroll fold domain-containing protein [Lutibacter sp. Hel_I_33_5]TVZ55206.1 putative secreted protein (Por secretion system target) [Lutibacter sp. Hel_I_33_5]